ncbi:MAG: DNA translocase FtsK [Candidatus Gracilibacteria bacterium]|nr:DNA translocase FtsK [Candidatus Gracilibacteria bacterium]
MPPKRKYTKKAGFHMTQDMKKYIAVSFFVFFGVLAIISETTSTFGYYIYMYGDLLFGEYYKFIFSPVVLLLSFFLIKNKSLEFNLYRFLGLFIYLVSLTTIIGYFHTILSYAGYFNVYELVNSFMGRSATLFTFSMLLLGSLVILFRFNPINFLHGLFSLAPKVSSIKETIKSELAATPATKKTKKEEKIDKKQKDLDEMMFKLQEEKKQLALAKQKEQMTLAELPEKPKKIKIEKKEKTLISGLFNKKEDEKPIEISEEHIIRNPEFKNWQFPELSLLSNRGGKIKYDENEIRRKEIEIEEKLLQFKIEVEMKGYQVGPTVIQFRLAPKQGVKLQSIENLKKDLALALHAKSLRIQAPIPGLGVVGIEVPNSNRQTVGLKEILASKVFNSKSMEIPVAIGKDVSGNVVVGDLAKMPHLLVAGQTGSGKSVGMNGFLISLLYKFSPSELKMIMVDPKRVELSVYNGIPHLLTPVITNPDKALNALKWCVAEMLRRYDMATKVNARNLKEYNEKMERDDRLPYIVMVIDELADLMMSGNKKEVEGSIARIAQMARAVGIHLIIATQRPSVDVITGLIKANIPSRIAFTVASQIDSRTVIDQGGAEDLLGRGDMLYAPTGSIEPERVQGVFVETNEVEAVVNKLKLTVDPDMISNLQIPEIAEGKSKLEGSILENYKGEQEEDPEIIEKAIQIVKESKKGSTSLIQRKLGLGYARAAKVLDILEELGVVGPSNGSKPREVYVD